MEKYAECPFSYHLRYGLNIKDRSNQSNNYFANIGTFLHEIIKETFDYIKENDINIDYFDLNIALDEIKNNANNFSKFEKEVLKYLIRGYSYREIAKILSKNLKSIDNTIQRIRKKSEEWIKKEENIKR